MKKSIRKLLSFLLALTMVIGSAQIVLAEDGDGGINLPPDEFSVVESVVIDNAPTKVYVTDETDYFYEVNGATVFTPTDYTGLQFTVNYDDGTSQTFTDQDDLADMMANDELAFIYDETDTSAGTHTITLSYHGQTAQYTVTVEEPAVEPPAEITGTCGPNAFWKIEGDTITIYGTGAMTNYGTKADVPWKDYKAGLTTVVVEAGITRVGNYAFMECENVTSVTLPNTVTTLALNSFSTCSKLKAITLPASVTTITNYAFSKCGFLRTINFAGTTAPTSVGNYAFNEVTGKATFPSSQSWSEFNFRGFGGSIYWVGSDEVGAVGGVSGPTASWKYYDKTLTILGTASTRSYGSKNETPWAQYAEEIENIKILDGITYIGNYTFMGCINATSVEMVDTVKGLGVNAFSTCESLESITLSSGLTTIRNYAFNKCSALSTVVFTSTKAPTEVGNYAFNGIVTKAVYPENDSWAAFNKHGYGGAMYWAGTSEADETFGGNCGYTTSWKIYDGVLHIGGIGAITSYGSKTKVPWYQYREQITAIEIEDTITGIGNYAFMECSNAATVTIGSGVKNIGINAFGKCTSITSITLPASVTLIRNYAFNNCTNLAELILLGNKPNTAVTAFNGTKVKI